MPSSPASPQTGTGGSRPSRAVQAGEFASLAWWHRRVRETGFDLDRLAEESGIGRKRLAALYREACFEGIGKMLREQRCLVARQWLRRLLSVKEAATRAGYRHATQFIADFRSVYGTTPGAFRKSLRDGNEWSWTPEFRRSRRARLLAAARGRLANPSNGRRRPNP